MKRILIILILCTGVANAQNALILSTTSEKTSTSNVDTEEKADSEVTENRIGTAEDIENDIVCYSETSKVAFFEALISKNDFDIELKDSEAVAIKSTEEMISKLRERTLLASVE